jgi:hypothetical protein
MTDRLDQLMARLASAATDRPLGSFGAEVLEGIAGRRRQARAALSLAPVGAASIAMALALGVTVGSVTAGAARPSRSNTFALAADLAPSTLLDSSR